MRAWEFDIYILIWALSIFTRKPREQMSFIDAISILATFISDRELWRLISSRTHCRAFLSCQSLYRIGWRFIDAAAK